jgi:hypothetical protein
MSLPSQLARLNPSGRSNMYRGRKNRPKPLLIGGGIALVVIVGGWLLFRGGSSPAGNPQVESASLALGPQTAAAAPAAPPPRQAEPVQEPVKREPPPPPPLELRQGRPDAPVVTTSPARPGTTAPSPIIGAPATSTAPDDGGKGSFDAAEPVWPNAAPQEPRSAPLPAVEPPSTAPALSTLTAARQKQAAGDMIGARVLFSRALREARGEADRSAIRGELTRISDELVFSRRIAPGDPWAFPYSVQPNDSLVRINQRQGLAPDWRLIQRINGMSNPNRLQVGQTLKLLRGPFHAVVSKSAFRLDLYMGPADREEDWLFIRSFPVGLGEGGSTPLGTFVVRRNSKLINPHWVNPRTGQHFTADDPQNPIGEHWIGLEGIGDSAGYVGYGLHGTIDPASIGREMSMGCVRLLDADIELIYELLGEQVSVVRIEP